ncbi:inheritance of peroxisomes protein 1-domain-containing protein [Xylaria bambusicola]|uniref:inheritance of peroxisomes protein 1-domain-containing protein n=1 Tax=Xylaria bambusicola TaxID=326684 RepID=UPI0020072102|nr:inheritance of peroxisomes protein 1-domain-containing protein [Xylaria bambusicola]KAI0503324.1 inheritance of peroxisomes protein 1-domain-containing protein [Xylaria bambusicola]
MDSPEFASNRPGIPQPRRVMTAPVGTSIALQGSTSSSSMSATSHDVSNAVPEDPVETLYSHPSVRIISFTSSHRDYTRSFTGSSDKDVPPGTLPPSSGLERTIAVGAFRIYRAPGSVAFLSCGSALQPILPKSQCWCIHEDNSRFVLQIRRPQYWRIELPVAHPDDILRALLLRDVFDKILLFEKTICPFKRSFTVELPDPPETPIRKAWTAEGKNLISSPFSELSPPAHEPIAISRGKLTNVSEFWSLGSIPPRDEDAFRSWAEAHISDVDEHGNAGTPRNVGPIHHPFPDVDNEHVELLEHGIYTRSNHPAGKVGLEREACQKPDTPDSTEISQDTKQTASNSHQNNHIMSNQHLSNGEDGEDGPSFEGSGRVAPVNLTRKRMTRMLAGRSFSGRPHTANDTRSYSPPALARGRSSSVSAGPFCNVQPRRSHTTPLAASPRARDVSLKLESAELSELNPHAASSVISNDTAAPTPQVQRVMDAKTDEHVNTESSPRASRSSPEESPLYPSKGKLRTHRRPHASSLSISRPALSPLPSAANLFSGAPKQTPQNHFATAHQVPTSIVQKILGVLLGVPSYLIKLMLQVTAKIIAGEWRGLVLGLNEAGEEIPVQWDYYSDGEFSELSDSEDYTLTNRSSTINDNLTHTSTRRRVRSKRDSNHDDDSWEVD